MKVGITNMLLLCLLAFSSWVPSELEAQNDWGESVERTVPPVVHRLGTYRGPNLRSPLGYMFGDFRTPTTKLAGNNLFGIQLGNSQPAVSQPIGQLPRIRPAQHTLEAIEGVGEIEFEEFGEGDIYYEGDTQVGEVLGENVFEDSCSACGQCGGNSCPNCQNGGLILVGRGVSFLQPSWQSNPAFRIGNTVQDFDWDLVASRYAWIGIRGSSGLGLRARYTTFDDDTTTSQLVPAGMSAFSAMPFSQSIDVGPGGTIDAEHEIEVHLSDLEFSYEKADGCWGLETAGGVRYIDLDQYYLVNTTAAGGARNSLRSFHGFDGIGPTVLVKGRHTLGLFGVNLFGSARESLLFGDRDSTVSIGGGAFQGQSSDGVMSISEVEFGMQRIIVLRRFRASLELALNGQLWTGVGNGANADIYSAQRDQNMGLFGGRISLDVSF